MEIGNSMFSFGILVLFGVMTCGVTGQPDINVLTVVNNELIRLINNCTVGDSDSCFPGHCCTKTFLRYDLGYTGDKPVYQLECRPLRQTGEFCYFDTPEHFCPCATRCHTNGFYGSCL